MRGGDIEDIESDEKERKPTTGFSFSFVTQKKRSFFFFLFISFFFLILIFVYSEAREGVFFLASSDLTTTTPHPQLFHFFLLSGCVQ